MPFKTSNFTSSNFLPSNFISSNFNYSYSSGTTPVVPIIEVNAPAVWMGDSITAAGASESIADWHKYFSDGRIAGVYLCNQGVSGNQTSAMIARQSVGLALNPSLYYILGGTNDIVIGGQTANTITTNLRTLIDNAKATPSVKLVVIRTILKRSDSSFLANPNFEVVRQAVNAWIMALNEPKVLAINEDLSVFNPVLHTSDGLHPNKLGAFILGQYDATFVNPYLIAGDILQDNASATNMVVNTQLSGTTGGLTALSGAVATSWRVRNFVTGLTGFVSREAVDASNWRQIVTLNGTAVSTGFLDFACPNITVSTVVSGTYEYLMQMDIVNVTGVDGINLVCGGCVNTGDTGSNPMQWTVMNGSTLTGVLRLSASVVTSAFTSTTPLFRINVGAGSTMTNTQVKYSRPIYRRVS